MRGLLQASLVRWGSEALRLIWVICCMPKRCVNIWLRATEDSSLNISDLICDAMTLCGHGAE